jgi:hypothetical protein
MALDPKLLLVLKSDHFGVDAPDLGAKLTANFLKMLLEAERQPAILICMGSAIFLTTEGSPVLDTLRQLQAGGTTIRSCLTCLEYFSRKDQLAVGEAGNMKETVAALLGFEKVIQE